MDEYTFTGNSDRDLFFFLSVGPKGQIPKLVRFDNVGLYYNLALGDIQEDGTINFTAPTNNDDILKVLNTVAAIIDDFSAAHPGQDIFITGSDDQRTNVYHWRIKRRLQSSHKKFGLMGRKGDLYPWEPFNESESYAAFLVVPLE